MIETTSFEDFKDQEFGKVGTPMRDEYEKELAMEASKTESKINQYLSNQENLPDFIKDFHDQKDLFKAIYAQYSEGNNKKLLSDVNWVDAHCFTIDVFLWWMGRHGYKLQKTRKKGVEFYDPIVTIEYYTQLRKSKSLNFLK